MYDLKYVFCSVQFLSEAWTEMKQNQPTQENFKCIERHLYVRSFLFFTLRGGHKFAPKEVEAQNKI